MMNIPPHCCNLGSWHDYINSNFGKIPFDYIICFDFAMQGVKSYEESVVQSILSPFPKFITSTPTRLTISTSFIKPLH